MSKASLPSALIFGAGQAGQSALPRLQDSYRVIGYIDNNLSLQGQTLAGLPIYSMQQISQVQVDKIFIASEFAEQISQQLAQSDMDICIEVLPARMLKPCLFEEDEGAKKMALVMLNWVSQTLRQAAIRHYVDAGTLLGIVRDNALIPWDDDLDIALHSEDVALCVTTLTSRLDELERLTNIKWKVSTHYSLEANGNVPKDAVRALKLHPFNDSDKAPLMDFFVKYCDAKWMDYCLSSRLIRMPSHHFTQTSTHQFGGFSVNLPSQPEQYLQSHYGDWKTPKRDWSLSDLSNTTLI